MKGSMSSKSIPIGTTRKKMYSVEEENLFKRGEELIRVLNEGIKENNQGQLIINSNIFLNLKYFCSKFLFRLQGKYSHCQKSSVLMMKLTDFRF